MTIDVICFHISEYTDRLVTPETRIADLNVDSLELIKLATDLEEKYNIKVTNTAILQWNTVADIAAYVDSQVPKVIHVPWTRRMKHRMLNWMREKIYG